MIFLSRRNADGEAARVHCVVRQHSMTDRAQAMFTRAQARRGLAGPQPCGRVLLRTDAPPNRQSDHVVPPQDLKGVLVTLAGAAALGVVSLASLGAGASRRASRSRSATAECARRRSLGLLQRALRICRRPRARPVRGRHRQSRRMRTAHCSAAPSDQASDGRQPGYGRVLEAVHRLPASPGRIRCDAGACQGGCTGTASSGSSGRRDPLPAWQAGPELRLVAARHARPQDRLGRVPGKRDDRSTRC